MKNKLFEKVFIMKNVILTIVLTALSATSFANCVDVKNNHKTEISNQLKSVANDSYYIYNKRQLKVVNENENVCTYRYYDYENNIDVDLEIEK